MSEEFTPFSTQQDGMVEKIYQGKGESCDVRWVFSTHHIQKVLLNLS